MFNLIKSTIQITILSIVFLFSTYAVIAAWSEPAGGPTGNNASTPLDVSSTGQTKVGGLILNTGAAANGLIVSAGNVGIGTTNPGITGATVPLTVSGPTGAYFKIQNDSIPYNAGIWMHEATNKFGYYLGTNNSDYLRLSYGTSAVDEAGALVDGKDNIGGITIDTSGRVGVGTASPGSTLDVNGVARSKGVVDASSAAAGYVGEYVTCSGTPGANAPSSATTGDICSLSITAGDWDCSTAMLYSNITTLTSCFFGVGTVAGNDNTGLVNGDSEIRCPWSSSNAGGSLAGLRENVAITTTLYYKLNMTYSGSTPQIYGRMSCRRMR